MKNFLKILFLFLFLSSSTGQSIDNLKGFWTNGDITIEIYPDYINLYSIRRNNSLEFSVDLINWKKGIPNLNYYSSGITVSGYDYIFVRYGVAE